MSLIFFVLAFALFVLLGLDVIDGPRNDDVFEFASAFVALGLALGGIPLPTIFRKE